MADQTPDAMMTVGVEADLSVVIKQLQGLDAKIKEKPFKAEVSLDPGSMKQFESASIIGIRKLTAEAKKTMGEALKEGLDFKQAYSKTKSHLETLFSNLSNMIAHSDAELAAELRAMFTKAVDGVFDEFLAKFESEAMSAAQKTKGIISIVRGQQADASKKWMNSFVKESDAIAKKNVAKTESQKAAEYKKYRDELAGEKAGETAREMLAADRKRKEEKEKSAFDASRSKGSSLSHFEVGMESAKERFEKARLLVGDPAASKQLAEEQVELLRKYVADVNRLHRSLGKSKLDAAIEASKAGFDAGTTAGMTLPEISQGTSVAVSVMRRESKKEQEALFSEKAIKQQVSDLTKKRGLVGEELFQEAKRIRDEIEAKAASYYGPGTAGHGEVRETLRRAFSGILDSRASLDPEAGKEIARNILKSIGGPGNARVSDSAIRTGLYESLGQVNETRKNLLKELSSASRLQEPEIKEQLFDNERQEIEINRRIKRLGELSEERAVLAEKIRKSEKGVLSSIRSRFWNSQMEKNLAEREQIMGGGPAKGKLSAHGAQFAAMNAAYGMQDFFQVLAQPGMGPGRAFLAAANNIGPALGAIPGVGIAATVAIGGVMAGMAGLNAVMDKNSEKLKENAKRVKELSDSYQGFLDMRSKFLFSVQSGPSATGAEGFSDLFSQLMGSGAGLSGIGGNVRQMSGMSRQSQYGAGAWARYIGEGFRQIANPFVYLLTAGQASGSYGGDPIADLKLATQNTIGFRESEIESREDLFFRNPDPFNVALARDENLRGRGREYDRWKSLREKDLAAMREQGVIKKVSDSIAEQERIGRIIGIAAKNVGKVPQNMLEGFEQAGSLERSLGVSGLRTSFLQRAYSQRQGFAEQEMSARKLVDQLKSDPERQLNLRSMEELRSQLAQQKAAGQPTFRIEAQIADLEAAMKPFELAIKNAEANVRLFGEQAKRSAEGFDLLAKQPGMWAQAALLRGGGPDFDAFFGGIVGREERSKKVGELISRRGDMNPLEFGKVQQMIREISFGDDFATSKEKARGIFSEMKERSGIAKAFGEEGAIPGIRENAIRKLGQEWGFAVEEPANATARLVERLEELKRSLDEVGGAAAEAGKKVAVRDLFAKEGFGVSLETQLKKMRDAFENLKPAMRDLNPADRAEVARQQADKERDLLRSPFTSRGFGMSLETQRKDFEEDVRRMEEGMKNLNPADQEFVRQQIRQRRFQMQRESPDEVARRNAMGGYVDRYQYGGTTGKILNFEDRIKALREQYGADLMQPGLTDEGKRSLGTKHRRAVEREVAGMIDGGSGKATMMESGSLWQRIQESLTSDPSLEIERSQLEELRRMNENLMRGLSPQDGRFGEWLNPLQQNVPGAAQVAGGPLLALGRPADAALGEIALNSAQTNIILENKLTEVVDAVLSSGLVIS